MERRFHLHMEGAPCPVDEGELLSFRLPDGSGFPVSYVRYLRQYGYGVACGEWIFYPPMGDHPDGFLRQSRAIRHTYRDTLDDPGDVWFPLEPDVNFERLRRLIPFGKSENGSYLFWEPARADPDEMDIYLTDFRGLGFLRAAGDLWELLDKMTDPGRYREVFPLFRDRELPATFRPLRR